MPNDNALFACEHDHEINYVASQYLETQKVMEKLKERCLGGGMGQWTHKEVHTWLMAQGFTRIKNCGGQMPPVG